MRCLLSTASFLPTLLFASGASAQISCDVALTSRAFNVTTSSVAENIAFSRRDDICRATYNSLEEAKGAAKNAGFNVSYAGIGIGASGAKTTSNNRTDISSTDFCQATAEDFKRSFSSTYDQQIADAALSAWTHCVEKNSNALYISYTISTDGQYFSGTIIKTVSLGPFLSTISGIAAVGMSPNKVECNIGGLSYKPGKLNVPITTTRTVFGCRKLADEGVLISVQTTGDALPPISMPSRKELSENRFNEIETRLDTLLPAALGRAVVPFEGGCPTGWRIYEEAAGRSIVGINRANSDGKSDNGLPIYEAGKDYGKSSFTLEVDNIPPHHHSYKDIFFSEAWGDVAVPGGVGSAKSDRDNKGYQIDRVTQPTGSSKPFFFQVPVRSLQFCLKHQ